MNRVITEPSNENIITSVCDLNIKVLLVSLPLVIYLTSNNIFSLYFNKYKFEK